MPYSDNPLVRSLGNEGRELSGRHGEEGLDEVWSTVVSLVRLSVLYGQSTVLAMSSDPRIAELTGKRRLSSQEDAGSEVLSPGARMAAIPRLSGATVR
jgi:hypothetical protein